MESDPSLSHDSLDATDKVASRWLPTDEFENRPTVPIPETPPQRRANPNVVRRDPVALVHELGSRIDRSAVAVRANTLTPAKPLPRVKPQEPAPWKTMATSRAAASGRMPAPAIAPAVASAPPPALPVPAAVAPPPVRVEPAPVRVELAPARVEPAPVRAPATFGASMLQARKGRTAEWRDTSTVASGQSRTFGASMLHARKSRAKYVMIVVLVLAGIAAIGLSSPSGSTSHPSATAPHKG